MKLVLLLVVLGTISAEVQDLSRKMFTFPQSSNTAHVKLNPAKLDYNAVTVCHRSITDLERDHAIFSLSTPSQDNGFLTFWKNANREIQPHIKNARVEYKGWDYKLNKWHSICTTWDSENGLVQIWVDGIPSIRKFSISGAISGAVKVVLGQDQDNHGGGFDVNQSFVGMITDVHMWDHILSSCDIQNYMGEMNFTPGNVLNWKALDFEIVGKVLIEDKPACHSTSVFLG
ncbi:serum amyloid P-component [Oryzias melastigma]|uniref:Pentraxin family member n=1 Tax=Oryzias melastigma TaxID=30732 RepID=A0A3B3BBM9_ORYME|nr:serum amyloid P-component [Oryzias melastigma]